MLPSFNKMYDILFIGQLLYSKSHMNVVEDMN